MPIYNIQGPDGRIYSLEGPEGATEDQVINALKANLGSQGILSAPEPAVPPAPPAGGFIPAVQRGALQTSSLLFDILPAMAARAVGADAYAEKQFAEAAETERKIQEKYAAAVPSYKDIKGVGDAITYLTESVGELVPSILPSIVTGGIAGIAGRGAVLAAKEAAEAAARKKVAEQGAEALAKKEIQDEIRQAGIDAARRTALKYDAIGVVGGSSLQNVPEVYKNIKDETEQESLGTALLFGGFNSLLDAALPLSVLTKLRKSGIPEEQVIGAWYKRFGVGAAKGFATEGATEAAQEMSSAAAEKFIDNNIEFFSEKNLERFLNAGLKGGLGGGVISGTTDVVLGKKSLTEDLKPLDEDIRNTQADILARRAFLDELRAQADEEGRNRLDEDALRDLGFRKGSLRDSLLNKDINDPAQAEEVRAVLTAAINDPAIRGRERAAVNDTLNVINEYVTTREAAPDVGQVVEAAGGEGVSVPVGPAEVGAAPGVEGVERTRVVPPAEDVAVAPPGEGLPTAPVEAPVEAPVPEVAQASVPTAPAPEVAVQPAPAPAEAVTAPAAPEAPVPTTRELIAEQEAGLAKQMEKFQGLLQEQVKRYGLKDVGVKVIDDLKNANGMYSKGLIQLAVDTADPVRALKHESVHALKELGFFTPAQWQSLVKQANTTWINTYMRNRDVDGNYLQPGQQSRYDAYINLFKQQGLDDAAIQEAMVEEAIADAFGDFAVAKEKPGMIRALINRMKNFFQSIKESIGMAEVTPERLFARVERGEVAAPAKPVAAEVKREEPVVEEKAAEEPKKSLRIAQGQEVPDIEGKITVDKIGKYFDDQIQKEFGRQLDYNNPEDLARAIKLATEETKYQLNQENSGLDWYEDDVRLAFEDTAKIIKELNAEDNRVLFSVIAGIMSPQTTARDNWFIAAKAFQHYVNTGDIPGVNPEGNKLWQGGTTSVNKRIQLEFLDRMVKDMGKDAAIKWLLSDHTVKEINQFRTKYGNIKSGIDGKLTDMKPGLYAFGPKVGPFVSNINGIHDVTVDMWMIRTFNRYFGTMIGPDGKIIDAPTEPQRRVVKDLINKVAQDANVKPYQVQSLLWFYEQRLYNQIGLPTKSYGFSDGGRRFLEESGRGGGAPSVATPAKAPAKVKKAEPTPPKFSISGPRLTPELRQAAQGSAIVDADGNLIPMYHGTAAAIRIFRPKQAGATFVSPDPAFASGFTSASRRWMVRHIGQFLKPDEIRKAVQELRQEIYGEYGKQSKMTSKIMDEIHDVLLEAKETGVYNFKGELEDKWYEIAFNMIPGAKERVMELYVLAKKPFDFENKADVNAIIKKMMTDPEVKRQYGYEAAPVGIDLQKPENFMLRQTLERSDKEYKAAVEAKFKDDLSRGSWTAIETPEVQKAIKGLGFDSFYVIEGGTKNLGVYDPKMIKSADENVGPFGQRPPTEEEAAALGMEPEEALKAQAEGDIRLSLRSQVDPAITARMLQTTTARDQKNFVERITDSIGPESRSRFRAAALNRYNRLGEADKLKLARMGGADLYADATAESAALLSDLASGIVAGSLGVYDKIGGVPVYNRYYAIEKQVPGPQGMQFIQVGGRISDRRAAEALAKRVGGEVKERGYVAVSNKDNTIKGPLAIFAPLAKYGDPDIYRYYQFWAGVKRSEKWIVNPQGQVVKERLFEASDIQKAKDLQQKFPEFVTIQEEWRKYNDALVQFMLDTGVLSQKQADEYRKHGDYMPFYRQIQGDDDAVGPRIFQPISAVKQPRKLKGGEDPLGDFLENMVRNTQSAVQAGMKNIASRRAADVGKDVGMVDKVPAGAKPDPINSFYVLENGEKVYYDTKDALFIESIKSLGLPEFPGIGILSAPANVLRNLVTKDPGFMLANMMRDSLAAWTTSGVNMVPIAATLKNFASAVAGQSPEFRTLQMAGVIGGYDYSQGTQEATEQFGKELRRTAGAQTAGEKAMRPFTYLWEGLEKGTQASDAATRIEVYKATLKETGNEAEALFRALEVMNFNRKGNNPIVRVATAAIPFLNARMQGLDVLYRAAFGRNATKNASEIQKAFWVRGMTMAALSVMYWLLTHDDEEYKRQEQETKDNNWLFPSLGIRVPIPFEVGVLFKVIPERIAALTLGDDTAKDFTQSMARNLMNTLAVNPIPQTILPVVEATTNYSFFTMRPIVGQGMEGVAPGYQVGPGTSRLAEALGKSTNISPMKIDQILQGYTGTIGQYMSDTIDAVWNMHTDNPKASKRFEQLPVIKRFVVNPDARGQVTAYYDLKNAVDEAARTANLLERSMNYEEYGKYMSENIQMFAFKDYILDLEKTMKEYRDMKNMIRSLPMEADMKRDSIRAIDQIENQMTSNIQLLKKQVQ